MKFNENYKASTYSKKLHDALETLVLAWHKDCKMLPVSPHDTLMLLDDSASASKLQIKR